MKKALNMKKPAQSVTPILPAVRPVAEIQTPTPPVARLNGISGVKSHLIWVVKGLEAGTLDPKIANALTVALNSLAGVIVDHEFEGRIKAIEEKQNETKP